VIRLFAALAKVYPPTRLAKDTKSNRTAGVKVATLFSARANGPARLELFPETTSEVDTPKIGPWVQGAAVLTDLGFCKHQGFARIEENGATSSPVSRATLTRSGSAPTSLTRVVPSTSKGSGVRRSLPDSTGGCAMPR